MPIMKVTTLQLEPGPNTDQLAAVVMGLSLQSAATHYRITKMSIEADNLRREVEETKAAVASTNTRVGEVLTLVANLRAALAQAVATGLTPAEVAAMAADLDAAQQTLAAGDAQIAAAVTDAAPAPAPAPVDPTTPPEAV